jgi:predicted NAD/FAD-dependent oxidoreductase
MLLEKGKQPKERQWSDIHYVPTPKMNSLCIKMAEDLNIRLNTEIIKIEKKDKLWFLSSKDKNIYGPFDWVITSIPATQTIKLLPEAITKHTSIKDVVMAGCYSVMIAMEEPFQWEWQAAIVKNSPISWMAINSNKPGRSEHHTLMVQTDNQWAEERIDADTAEIQSIIIKELSDLLSYDFSKSSYITTHRWRYADTKQPAGMDYHLNQDQKLGACGDWFIKGRIEAAFLSAYRLSKKLETML